MGLGRGRQGLRNGNLGRILTFLISLTERATSAVESSKEAALTDIRTQFHGAHQWIGLRRVEVEGEEMVCTVQNQQTRLRITFTNKVVLKRKDKFMN